VVSPGKSNKKTKVATTRSGGAGSSSGKHKCNNGKTNKQEDVIVDVVEQWWEDQRKRMEVQQKKDVEEVLQTMREHLLKEMDETIKVAVEERMADAKKDLCDVEMQKKIAVADLIEQRKHRGGYTTVADVLKDSNNIKQLMTRYEHSGKIYNGRG